ncbi:hypothetical protein G7Y89_g4361 [Cudoniella acicularis]|uniref:Uncharacterized protein n=1 Tax=Cudoniella acicularis TaxID=354080 RepID=A0A8H4RRL3_9HELO|nr:hypothetical protein G7Y89_g4361 [Cudoniella acicularis]
MQPRLMIFQYVSAQPGPHRDPIALHRIPGNAINLFLTSFHPKENLNNTDLYHAELRKNKFLSEIQNKYNLTLGFSIATEDAQTGKPAPSSFGVTHMNYIEQTISMYYSKEIVLQLLRPDLTGAERMSTEWFLASVIVHEIMTLLNCNKHCLIRALAFGGLASPFQESDEGYRPYLGFWFETNWPTLHQASLITSIELLWPYLFRVQKYFPISAFYYENIQQEGFWAVQVRSFGFNTPHRRTVGEGALVSYTSLLNEADAGKPKLDDNLKHISDAKKHNLDLKGETYRPNVGELSTLSPIERAALDAGMEFLTTVTLEHKYWNEVAKAKEYSCRYSRRAHELAMHALFQAEEHQGGNMFVQRRESLLEWNRRLRIYLKRLRSDVSQMTSVKREQWVKFLQDQRQGLEFTRMSLWLEEEKNTMGGKGSLEELQSLAAAVDFLKSNDFVGSGWIFWGFYK